MGKYNVYYTVTGVVQVDASNEDEAKYKIMFSQDKIIDEKRRFSVVEVMEKNYDNFFRCPRCRSIVQYFDYPKQEIHYLNKNGKRKRNYIVLQEEVEQALDGHLYCENNMCDYTMPYHWAFE